MVDLAGSERLSKSQSEGIRCAGVQSECLNLTILIYVSQVWGSDPRVCVLLPSDGRQRLVRFSELGGDVDFRLPLRRKRSLKDLVGHSTPGAGCLVSLPKEPEQCRRYGASCWGCCRFGLSKTATQPVRASVLQGRRPMQQKSRKVTEADKRKPWPAYWSGMPPPCI